MIRFKRLQTMIRYGEFPVKLFLCMLVVRCVDLLWVQSYFVPDEYYQSLEVAHRKVFGNGYLTWEWKKGIRSYFYVSLIQVLYEILNFLQIDSAELVIILPRILQGFISAVADSYFARWVHEKRSGQFSWGLLSWLTCYFLSFCSTRTLINTFEMNLTTIALYYYPWTPKSTNMVFVSLFSLLCYIRPTAVILWFPLVFLNIFNSKQPLSVIKHYVPAAAIIAALNVALDSYYYGTLTFTPLNFFKVNVIENIGSFYGTHNILWYWYIGLPVVLGLQVIPFYWRVLLKLLHPTQFIKSLKYDVESQMILTVFWTVSILSFIPHKEFRFLLPLLPMALFVSSAALGQWSVNAKNWLLYAVGALLITGSSGALLFLGRFHNVGPLETMSVIRNDFKNSTSARVLFLGPCHSFPFYSHLHSKVSARFLTCNPNLDNQTGYEDEAERFHLSPLTWLQIQFDTSRPCTLPTHIIKYDVLNITNFLHFHDYALKGQIFNSFFPPERTGKFVHIYKRKGKVC